MPNKKEQIAVLKKQVATARATHKAAMKTEDTLYRAGVKAREKADRTQVALEELETKLSQLCCRGPQAACPQ